MKYLSDILITLAFCLLVYAGFISHDLFDKIKIDLENKTLQINELKHDLDYLQIEIDEIKLNDK